MGVFLLLIPVHVTNRKKWCNLCLDLVNNIWILAYFEWVNNFQVSECHSNKCSPSFTLPGNCFHRQQKEAPSI